MINWQPADICCFEQLDEKGNPIAVIHITRVPADGAFFAWSNKGLRDPVVLENTGSYRTVSRNAYKLYRQLPASPKDPVEGFYIMYADTVSENENTGKYEMPKKNTGDPKPVNPLYEYVYIAKQNKWDWNKCDLKKGTNDGRDVMPDGQLIRFGEKGGQMLRFRLPPKLEEPIGVPNDDGYAEPAPVPAAPLPSERIAPFVSAVPPDIGAAPIRRNAAPSTGADESFTAADVPPDIAQDGTRRYTRPSVTEANDLMNTRKKRPHKGRRL